MTGASEPRYPYLVVEVPPGEADEAGALLFELGATGVEERDATTLVRGAPDRAVLVAAFESDAAATAAARELPAEWPSRIDHVVGDAWRDEWKKHFEPFRICPGVVVRPPWRTYDPEPGEHVVVLEPGRAFGTGLHETTRLVAEAMAERRSAIEGRDVLDVGCGSGILSLAAIALGAARARAVDVDPDAVAVTIENAARNGVADRVIADTTAIDHVESRHAFAVANIEALPLVAMASALTARVAPGGVLVLSGILATEVAPRQWEDVRRAYSALAVEEVRTQGEWLAAVLRAR